MTNHVVVLGGKGRLGSAIVAQLKASKELQVRGVVGRNEALKSIAQKGDVVIDATNGESVKRNLEQAMEIASSYVLAATGYDEPTKKLVAEFGKKLPIVVAPNLSVGVAVLSDLVSRATTALPEARIEIVETHHQHKKDAPSGTAKALAAATGKNPPIRSIREGEVIGEHEVTFQIDGEKVTLGHSASDRAIFARGAVLAAKFVALRKPGVYTMHNVLWPTLP